MSWVQATARRGSCVQSVINSTTKYKSKVVMQGEGYRVTIELTGTASLRGDPSAVAEAVREAAGVKEASVTLDW